MITVFFVDKFSDITIEATDIDQENARISTSTGLSFTVSKCDVCSGKMDKLFEKLALEFISLQ
jgi:hypothetical protein